MATSLALLVAVSVQAAAVVEDDVSTASDAVVVAVAVFCV